MNKVLLLKKLVAIANALLKEPAHVVPDNGTEIYTISNEEMVAEVHTRNGEVEFFSFSSRERILRQRRGAAQTENVFGDR